jgi:hypothetical protein
MRFLERLSLVVLLMVGSYFLSVVPGMAQAPYYAGKTITIVRGGGSGEFQSRALMLHGEA